MMLVLYSLGWSAWGVGAERRMCVKGLNPIPGLTVQLGATGSNWLLF